MPWCDDCSKFWNPPELAQSRDCPTCGRILVAAGGPRPAAPPARARGGAAPAGAGVSAAAVTARPATKAKGAPWHFKLLVVGVTGYMIYRIYWLIEWLPKHV